MCVPRPQLIGGEFRYVFREQTLQMKFQGLNVGDGHPRWLVGMAPNRAKSPLVRTSRLQKLVCDLCNGQLAAHVERRHGAAPVTHELCAM